MKNKITCLGAAALVALVLPAMSAKATVVYTTLGPGDAFETASGYLVDGSFNEVVASPFTVSSTAMLTNAMLGLNHIGGSNSPVNVFVESDASGVPGSILDTLTQQGTLPPYPTESVTTFTSSGGVTLTAGVTYWLVAQETDPNSEQFWDYAFNYPENVLAFNYSGSATGPWTTSPGIDVAFQINGTASVPESGSTAALLGLSALGLFYTRKLRGRLQRGL